MGTKQTVRLPAVLTAKQGINLQPGMRLQWHANNAANELMSICHNTARHNIEVPNESHHLHAEVNDEHFLPTNICSCREDLGLGSQAQKMGSQQQGVSCSAICGDPPQQSCKVR